MNRKNTGQHLQTLKQEQSEKTRVELLKALERFEAGKLNKLPKGSKLTRLNLAIEAGVTRDTPFAKYRFASDKSGEHRYPEIVNKFYSLKKSVKSVSDNSQKLKQQLALSRKQNKELQDLLTMSRNVVNAQDILIEKLKKDRESSNNDLLIIKKQSSEEISLLEKQISLLNDEMVLLKRNSLRAINRK